MDGGWWWGGVFLQVEEVEQIFGRWDDSPEISPAGKTLND